MNYLKKELFELIADNLKLFDFIQNKAFDGLWFWDVKNPENRWINEAFWSNLGYEPEELRKQEPDLLELIFPADLEVARAMAQEHYSDQNKPFESVIRYLHKNGDTVYLNTRAIAINNEVGEPYRMLGVVINVTAQKIQENQIQRQRDRFELIIEGSDLGTWEWNVQTGETVFNEKWANIIGYTLEELQPISIETWAKYCHPDDLEKSGALLNMHFEGKTDFYKVDVRMRHKNGKWVWVQDKGKVITWTDDGKPEWMFGSHQDISMKRKMEQSLAKSYRIAKTLVERSPISIAMFDTDMNYMAISPEWLDTNGLYNQDVIGKNHYDVTPGIKEEWKQMHARGLAGENLSSPGEEIIGPDGKKRWIKWDVRPWYQGREVGGIIIYTDDITEHKLQQIQLEKNKALIEKTNEIADIGTWEVNLVNMTTEWSLATKRIHEVEPDYTGTVESGIEFYKEGWSRDKISELFRRSITTGEPYDDEFIIVTQTGKERWVRAIGIPTMEDGKCVFIQGVFQNIDEQKRQQQIISSELESIKKLLEETHYNTRIGGWDANIEERSLVLADDTKDMLELDDSFDLDFKNIKQLYKSSDYARVKKAVEKSIETGEYFDIEIQHLTGKGNSIWTRLVGYPKLAEGKCVGLYGFIQDIEMRKKVLKELNIG